MGVGIEVGTAEVIETISETMSEAIELSTLCDSRELNSESRELITKVGAAVGN